MARRKSNSNIDSLFDEPQGQPWGRYAIGGGIALVLGFIIYAAIASQGGPQGPVPVIRADDTAWTRQPTEPGGMDIPNQDSTVFELMDKNASPEEIAAAEAAAAATGETPETAEKAVDKPVDETVEEPADGTVEKPVEDQAEMDADPVPGETPAPVIGAAAAPAVAELEEPAAEPVAEPEDKAEDKPVEKPVEKVAEKPVEPKKPANDYDAPYNPKATGAGAVDKPVSSPVASSGKTVRVRLGSVPGSDTALAAKEFARLKGMAAGKLSGSPSYEKVTLPKGSFVRINVSMDSAAARSLCDTLSSKGAPCVVLGQ